MPNFKKVRFKIKDYTPDTLPMSRLAEYLSDYAALLGNDEAVHFERVGEGSAVLVSRVLESEYLTVKQRSIDAARGVGPREAVCAFQSLNAKLKQDKTTGTLQAERGAKILHFPGVEAPEPEVFGPFNERGTLDGVLIKIGGKDQTIPVHIEDQNRVYICNATRDLAKKLAPYLFGTPIRVSGIGRWVRNADGSWSLVGFNIDGFEELNDDSLPVVIERLRAIPNNGWNEVKDPIAELRSIRTGEKAN